MAPKYFVFFRNDDVDDFQPGLEGVTNSFIDRRLPLSHGVVPYLVSDKTVSWLSGLAGSGIEVIQHGFAHKKFDKGEFGGNRSFESQWQDMSQGKKILEERFGEQFFSMC